MAKPSSGGKKWTSKQGSWGNSYLIEGYRTPQEQPSYDKYNDYVVDVSEKAKKAFNTRAYSDYTRKNCPKCGSSEIMITRKGRKGTAKSYLCNECKYRW